MESVSTMAYAIYGPISYILEADSKRPVWEKKKIEYEVAEEIEWANFFSFLAKIFRNI